ncbi:MAG: response regulator transcription factor [Burkholderiaceae bacterium]|nr:response regulator transcription factor [Burkholderiaceae bacterium]
MVSLTNTTAPDNEQTLRLLLVEDNPLFAEQICAAVAQQAQAWSIHTASEGQQALALVREPRQHFDLALIDMGLPDISGLEVIKACHKQFPDLPIVVISVVAAEPVVLSAIEAGAKGYLLKDESIQQITKGIAQVMEGIYPLSPSLARFLFKKLAGEQNTAAHDTDFKLTPRELETLRFLSQGLSYDRVAQQMGVALSTIQSNVRNLYRKLNVRSQVQAITKARNHDLL